jgi:large subunit ribosomal protein L17
MVTSLLKYERIRTTGTKAKELRRWADHIITLAKRGDLHARRQALAIVREKDVVHKLFETANERFGSQSGGYTRIVKLGRRPGDAAPISMIELVATQDTKKKKSRKKKVKAEAASTKPAFDKKAVKKEAKPEKDAKTESAPADKAAETALKAEEKVEQKVDAPVKAKAEEVEAKAAVSKEDAGDEKEEKPGAEAAREKKARAKKDDKAKTAGGDDAEKTGRKE